ncbi:MAG TPA: MBL fold metallo-hydrolase [Terriglobia bacterium]|nr:MBL fold metallo-hydrolase [Terriglobia bacterium]
MQPGETDHFGNGHFQNHDARPGGFLDLIRWLRTRQPGAWRKWIPSGYGPKPSERLGGNQLRVTFIGHSTVLIQAGAFNFLTDPIWSHRASPVQWAGPKRHRAPGLRLEDLPPLDAILVSHDHFDHLDVSTLRGLRTHRAQIFCPLGVAKLLRKVGYSDPIELDWWESSEFSSAIRVHCTPAQHFSGRSLFDRNRTLWCSWLIENSHGNIYFGADTGFGLHFAEITRHFPSPRLALLPIGAYRPRWFMSPVHMSPDEAVTAHQILQAQTSVAIHHGTFRLADDGETEAVDRLRELMSLPADDARSARPFLALEAGVGYDVV